MVIGSHNSWSYHRARRWWLRPLAWMAKCQRVPIATQYDVFGVRCFDLRVRFSRDGHLRVAHGLCEYDITDNRLFDDLNYLNAKGDCLVRVLHEVRTKRAHTEERVRKFRRLMSAMEGRYVAIRFWCGRNLATWEVDYQFYEPDPSCAERYGSVCQRWMGWWPWLWAWRHNAEAKARKYAEQVLLVDYVDIG